MICGTEFRNSLITSPALSIETVLGSIRWGGRPFYEFMRRNLWRRITMFRVLGQLNKLHAVRCVGAAMLVAFLASCGAGRARAQSLTIPLVDESGSGSGISLFAAPESAAQEPASPAQQPAAPNPAPATPPAKPQTPLPDAPSPASTATPSQNAKTGCLYPPCMPPTNWYMRFVNGPQVKPLTPKEKGWLALRNFVDPFNAITILADAAISVGADSHSDYGPGMAGFGRYVGVSFSQDLTGEFFDTFLIPSIAHQDPHYHRMPHASYPRRVFHAIAQVAWTQGDNGKGMLNYANLVGYAIDDEISNLYVPGRETNASATAQRYAIGLATAPIDNFITEFLPDVARHIHVQIVVVQRIINQVASKDSGGV